MNSSQHGGLIGALEAQLGQMLLAGHQLELDGGGISNACAASKYEATSAEKVPSRSLRSVCSVVRRCWSNFCSNLRTNLQGPYQDEGVQP